VPPALVGKWQVQEGLQSGGIFEFSRNGQLLIRLKDSRSERPLKARVVVSGKKMVTTTQDPFTRQEQSDTSYIRELTANTLILELEQGKVLKMVR
jgi:hypothetical protein